MAGSGDQRLDRRDCIGSFGAVGTTGLRHIGASAATGAAKGRRSRANQIHRAEAADHILCDCGNGAGLAIFTHANEQHNTGTDLLLAFIGKRLQIARRNTCHDLAEEIDAIDSLDSTAAIG